MKPINVGLLGIGTVGGGTYAVLDDNDCVVTVGHRTQRINRH